MTSAVVELPKSKIWGQSVAWGFIRSFRVWGLLEALGYGGLLEALEC